MIKLMDLKMLFNQRKERLFSERHTQGSMIRFYRVKRKVTLEEVARDICSVSYLSKLENNLIKPSAKFMTALYERLCIQESMEDIDLSSLVEKVLEGVSLFDHSVDWAKIDVEKYPNSYQSNLLMLVKSVYEGSYESCSSYYHDAILYLPVFNQNEVALFLYAVVTILFYQESYDKIVEIHDLIFEIVHPMIREYLKVMLYKSAWLSGHDVEEKNLSATKHFLMNNRNIELLYELSKYELYYKSYFGEIDIEKLCQDYQLSSNDQYFIKAKHAYHQANYERAYFLIQQISKRNEDESILYAILQDKLNCFKPVEKVYQSRGKHFVYSYLMVKHQHDKQLRIYIKQRMMDVQAIVGDFYLAEYLMMDMVVIFKKVQFYKESLRIMLQYNDMLRKKLIHT